MQPEKSRTQQSQPKALYQTSHEAEVTAMLFLFPSRLEGSMLGTATHGVDDGRETP